MMKKRIYIVWSHHHALKEWIKYQECGVHLLSFDYHTDFHKAFIGKSGDPVENFRYSSKRHNLYLNKHIPCKDIENAVKDLKNDEHIDFAIRSGIISKAYVFSHDEYGNRDGVLTVPAIEMNDEQIRIAEALSRFAPRVLSDSARGDDVVSHDVHADVQAEDAIISFPEHRHPLLIVHDESQRAKLVTTNEVLDKVVETFRKYGFDRGNYILDFDCDFIRDPRSMTHGQLQTLKGLIRDAKAITIAREPKCVIECSEGKLCSEVIEAWFRGLMQGCVDDIEIIDEYETKIEMSAVIDQTAIAEKLRECAKMQLEVANEIQLARYALLPNVREGGEGRAVELGQTAESDYEKVIEVIRETRRASVSHFQRKLGYGYNHACEVMDRLEKAGIVGPDMGGPREIFWEKIPRYL